MINPLFTVCAASPALTALIGSDPVRLYAFGSQDDEVIYPYVTWQNTGGEPALYLGSRPDIDRWTVQIDVWASTADAEKTDGHSRSGRCRDDLMRVQENVPPFLQGA
ncbi:tail completion protein gp17 [Escherichia coli]|uniref:tail completion protein gp17 n=1 Tax=Escherichia coli TaxID=562 RepID=UPI0031B59164